jgi:hypothetical protein
VYIDAATDFKSEFLISKLRTKNKGRMNIRIKVSVFFTMSYKFRQMHSYNGARGGVVVKALRYKPAGRGFDSRWCHWNFSVT